jgi:hypothetical protein
MTQPLLELECGGQLGKCSQKIPEYFRERILKWKNTKCVLNTDGYIRNSIVCYLRGGNAETVKQYNTHIHRYCTVMYKYCS